MPAPLLQQRQSLSTSPAARQHRPPTVKPGVSHPLLQQGCALNFDNWRRKWRHSSENLPPTSHARTTNRARPPHRPTQCSVAASSFVVHGRCPINVSTPTPVQLRGETIVLLMANCGPWNRERPSATPPIGGCRLRWVWQCPSRGPSRHTRAAADSKAQPRRPNTPTLAHAARWWPKESRRRPHPQMRLVRGRGSHKRRRRSTRNT